MYASRERGTWGGLGEYVASGLEERVGTSVEAAKQYLRARWTEFLALGPRIIDLQHEAALVAQRARARGDAAGEAAAKQEILRLGEMNKAHGWAIDTYNLKEVGQALGLGAVPVAGALAFSSIALVVLWAFRAYAASAEKLRLIEAGVLTPEQAAQLDPGPSPQMLFRGATDLATLAMWGLGLWLAFQLFTLYAPGKRARSNPPLDVWNANPPEVLGEEVYAVTYRHDEDGRDYIHEFGPDVELEALPDGSVLLSHRHGLRLWDDFEEPSE